MTGWLIRIVDASRQHAMAVVLAFTALTAVCTCYAAGHLGIDSDTDHMFATGLPWRQHQLAFDREFPQFDDLLVAVVRGATPEETDQAAAALATTLRADRQHFHDVTRPDADPFFRHEGLLLLDPDDLAKLLDSLMAAQPLLGPLASDPSARGLLQGVSLMAEGVRIEHADLSAYSAALRELQQVLEHAAAGQPQPLSWQSLLGSDVTRQTDNMRLLLMHPVLEANSLQPGLAATQSLEHASAALPGVRSGRVRVNYTGSVALSDVQFGALTEGIVGSTLVSLALLALWLYLALRSWRLIAPVLLTLLAGLALTLGFAALAIGTLNLISVAFAVLFVGLAVDFAIQFAVRLRDERLHQPALADALNGTTRAAGAQIAVAAVAIACGFLAFAPTAFVGVAELGLIAGVGMGLALLCTLTLLPALLWLFQPRDQQRELALPFGKTCDALLQRHRRIVLAVFAVLAVTGTVATVRMPFDANPLHTQDPDSEPMRTLRSLADNPVTNPFNIDIMATDLARARELGDRLAHLPEVASVISGATFVPAKQQAQLDQLEQAQDLLLPSLDPEGNAPPVTPAALREAVADTHDAIVRAGANLPADSPLRGIDHALQQLGNAPDARLLAMNEAVTRFLPDELASLRDALNAAPITRQNLPASIRRDWFAADGQVHLQVSPTAAAHDTAGLRRFVDAVQAIAPDAGGSAVTTITSADTIMHAFRQAAVLATLAIAVVLLIALRHLRDTGIVLLTLSMSALLTALLALLAGMAINYANIIALPLLLGVGVSFNVYFVMNWRAGMRSFVGSASARAVLFSALTTGTAFGSLALSHDRGMASMGSLLLLSLVAVLLATFVFLPALLYTVKPTSARAALT
ncbi:MMPL family transporter [Rhodanobacter sp. C01]|uniref:MMPL family transporter n=1 Tax=Rhodanobacter sp. C01 TaxID=1945856 RepID=UPI000986F4AE|nr:MMPL family transporter [Rhodanobacter sp. C01]OOG45549.1 RND transporter [Rhodanobacter sp. C01]